jgi:hypothetical protein
MNVGLTTFSGDWRLNERKPSRKLERAGGKLILSTASANFFLGVLFRPEDGSDLLIRNVGIYPHYTE